MTSENPMVLDPAAAALLRCPITRQPLRVMDDETFRARRAGSPLADVEGAFLTADGQRAYPIRQGFPVLLAEAAVAWD